MSCFTLRALLCTQNTSCVSLCLQAIAFNALPAARACIIEQCDAVRMGFDFAFPHAGFTHLSARHDLRMAVRSSVQGACLHSRPSYSTLQAHLNGGDSAGLPAVGWWPTAPHPSACCQPAALRWLVLTIDCSFTPTVCCAVCNGVCLCHAGVPYDLTPEFLNELFTKHRIDYVIHGDDPCLLPDGTDAYEHAKKMGRFRMVGCSKPSQALGRSWKALLGHLPGASGCCAPSWRCATWLADGPDWSGMLLKLPLCTRVH